MARDVRDGLIFSSALGEISDESVPVVVPPPRHLGVFADISPGRLEGCDGARRVSRAGPSKRKDISLIDTHRVAASRQFQLDHLAVRRTGSG